MLVLAHAVLFAFSAPTGVSSPTKKWGGDLAVDHQHAHKGAIDAAMTVVRTNGIGGLYAGLPAFFCRCVALVATDWLLPLVRCIYSTRSHTGSAHTRRRHG